MLVQNRAILDLECGLLGRGLGPHQFLIALRNLPRDSADFEVPVTDLADGGDLGGRAGQPALLEAFKFLGQNVAFMHDDLPILKHSHDGLPRDAVQEAIGSWRVHFPVFHKEEAPEYVLEEGFDTVQEFKCRFLSLHFRASGLESRDTF